MEKTTNALQTLNTEINTQVDASLGSLFTKDDVKSVINSLFEKVFDIINDIEPQQVSINHEVVLEMVSNALDDLDNDTYFECSELDNLKFQIDYSNQVEMEHYDLDFNVSKFKNYLLPIVLQQYKNIVEVNETNVSV